MRSEMERIEPKEAAETLRRYLDTDPGDWQARRAQAHAEELLENRSEADSLMAQCLRERPDSVDGWRMWLTILADRNQPEELARAIATMPASVAQANDATIQQLRALDRFNAGELQQALELFQTALELDPHNPDTHYRLASVAQRLGQADLAEERRAASQRIRKARQAIPEALLKFRTHERPGTPGRAEAIEALAQISDTVGWNRLAREWRKLAKNEP